MWPVTRASLDPLWAGQSPALGNARPPDPVTGILGRRHFLPRCLGGSHCQGDQLEAALAQGAAGGRGQGSRTSCEGCSGLVEPATRGLSRPQGPGPPTGQPHAHVTPHRAPPQVILSSPDPCSKSEIGGSKPPTSASSLCSHVYQGDVWSRLLGAGEHLVQPGDPHCPPEAEGAGPPRCYHSSPG